MDEEEDEEHDRAKETCLRCEGGASEVAAEGDDEDETVSGRVEG